MSGPAPYPEMLTIRDLAAVADVNVTTISRWITLGLITVKRAPDRSVQIPVKGLDFLPPAGDLLLCPAAVCDMTRLTPAQVYYARKQGQLTTVRTPGGHCRFLLSEVRRHRKGAGR